jgi:hypothetical protein
MLTLRTITFRHDPGNPAVSALPIRRNKDFEVLVPEYDSAVPRSPAEQCAAYAIGPTSGQPVTVALELEAAAPTNQPFEVRARGGGILGGLAPFVVDFGGGTNAAVSVPLARRRFRRVARREVTWTWQFRPKGASLWKPLGTTSHRIYLTLDVPVAPWSQVVADKHNPWTDLLDECCAVAAGTRTARRAAIRLTRRVHADFPLKYDIKWGAPRYGFGGMGGSFRLTEWIDYVLRGNAPTSPTFCAGDLHDYPDYDIVNCYDCAAALGIMANVLGVSLGYHFHGPFGYLEYVAPIGRARCNNPFPGCNGTNFALGPDDARTGFGNHAYTKLSGGNNYDACMREWVSPWRRLVLLLLWLLILILTLGLVNLEALRLRAGGWLVDLTQPEYADRTIDTSQPFEAAAAAGGAPAPVALDFQVT